MINSILNTSIQGLQKSMQEMQQSADTIARYNTTDKTSGIDTITEEIVNINIQENQAKASAEVISTTDDLLGTLLDLRA